MKNNNRLIYLLIIILLAWLLILSNEFSRLKKQDAANVINEYNITGFSTDFTRIIEESKPAVVTVEADGDLLSGFVYAQDGEDVYIVSAYHGLSSSNLINVHFGSSYQANAQLIGHDIYADLAVLRIRTPYQIAALKLSDADLLKQGEFLISIGTSGSLDFAGSVLLGMVAGNDLMIDNSISVGEERYSYFLNVIETSTNIQSGFSGSPLINMNGEAVGMNTMASASGTAFALSANEIRKVADLLISGEEYTRKNLGFRGYFIKDLYNYEKANLNLDFENTQGIYVDRVKENSLAFEAGIRSGDIITMINDQPVDGLNSYLDALYDSQEQTRFTYIRDGQMLQSDISSND